MAGICRQGGGAHDPCHRRYHAAHRHTHAQARTRGLPVAGRHYFRTWGDQVLGRRTQGGVQVNAGEDARQQCVALRARRQGGPE